MTAELAVQDQVSHAAVNAAGGRLLRPRAAGGQDRLHARSRRRDERALQRRRPRHHRFRRRDGRALAAGRPHPHRSRPTTRAASASSRTALNETIARLARRSAPSRPPRERRRRPPPARSTSGADDLSQRTEQQASSLEQTAATTEELAASVKASAQSSRQAVELAERGDARSPQTGGDIVREAVEAMARIEAASQQDLRHHLRHRRDRLPDQPAGAQRRRRSGAGRRGRQGLRGRRLRGAHAGAALQRGRQGHHRADQRLHRGGGAGRQAGALGRRRARARSWRPRSKVAATVTEISAAAGEQANGIDEMSQAVAHMDEMTQQNAALAEESAASAGSLTSQIQRLNDLVATFRTAQAPRGGCARGRAGGAARGPADERAGAPAPPGGGRLRGPKPRRRGRGSQGFRRQAGPQGAAAARARRQSRGLAALARAAGRERRRQLGRVLRAAQATSERGVPGRGAPLAFACEMAVASARRSFRMPCKSGRRAGAGRAGGSAATNDGPTRGRNHDTLHTPQRGGRGGEHRRAARHWSFRAGDAGRGSRRAQHHRCCRQSAAHAGRYRALRAATTRSSSSRVTFSRAPSPELPAKLKAQQEADRVDIDLVLTGPGALVGRHPAGTLGRRLEGARGAPAEARGRSIMSRRSMMQRNFGQDQGVAVVYSPSGPAVRICAGAGVKSVPKTAEDLLAWVKREPEPLHLRAPGEFRAGLDVPDGPALHPRRQGSRRIRRRAGTRPGPI